MVNTQNITSSIDIASSIDITSRMETRYLASFECRLLVPANELRDNSLNQVLKDPAPYPKGGKIDRLETPNHRFFTSFLIKLPMVSVNGCLYK